MTARRFGQQQSFFFAPELSFAGYLGGPRVGAAFYDLVQVCAFGGVLIAVGLTMDIPVLAALGSLWLPHSGFNRALG